MSSLTAKSDACFIATAQGRQILFYAPVGLLGGTFTCSSCGASARQPDVLAHMADCSYGSLRSPRLLPKAAP